MPPPPPPPPGPPPPPAMGSGDFLQIGKKETESRSLLLSSIRQGTKLKKSVTSDRSAPVVDGGSSNKNNNNSGGDFSRTNGAPPGLGGLFAGGMPKLKSVGQRNFEPNNAAALLPPNKKSVAPSPPVSKSDRINNAASMTQVPQNTYPGTMKRPNDRGPAPQPPPLSNKPMFGGNATLPRRMGPPLPNKPPVQANKPNLGPRPSPMGTKPTPPLKAPSLPAHPPNLRRPASMGEHDYRNGQLAKANLFTSSTSQLNGSISNQQMIGAVSPTQTNRNHLHQKQSAPLPPTPTAFRMAAPPPPARTTGTMARPPVARPPPPPAKAPVMVPPAPPPPPSTAPPPRSSFPPSHNSMAPPPPPHRGAGMKLLLPTPPAPAGQPPPPPRSSSCPPSKKTSGDDFESKFYHKFRNILELPPPEPYLNCSKTYKNSRRQPPPPPPLQFQSGSSPVFARQESNC